MQAIGSLVQGKHHTLAVIWQTMSQYSCCKFLKSQGTKTMCDRGFGVLLVSKQASLQGYIGPGNNGVCLEIALSCFLEKLIYQVQHPAATARPELMRENGSQPARSDGIPAGIGQRWLV